MKIASNISKFSDTELLGLFKETRDNKYFGELYSRYTVFLVAVCMKYLKDREKAKDAVMSIFEKLLKEITRHEVHNFKSWLHVTAKHYCLMELRKIQNISFESDENFSVKFMEFQDIGHHEENEEQLQNENKIKEAIEKLKPDQKECVVMFFIEEKSYKEIEEKTGLNYNEVKSNIQNGKRNLKLLLQGILLVFVYITLFQKK